MEASLLDNPLILSILFHPRVAQPHTSPQDNVTDGTIPIEGKIVLGYRLYIAEASQSVVLFFHGNGEIASDYDDIAPQFNRLGMSLLVVDYRGYGWSTGKPLASTLLSDTEAVYEALPPILQDAGLSGNPYYVMGRSLGSAPAIHLASEYPDAFVGIIIESGFAHVLPLLARLGFPAHMLGNLPDPIGNVKKIQSLQMPLLVIHGERDQLIPVANGQALYESSPAKHKSILRIPNAGHNDLLYRGMEEYFGAIGDFVKMTGEN